MYTNSVTKVSLMTKDVMQTQSYDALTNLKEFELILPNAWSQLTSFEFTKFRHLTELVVKTFRGKMASMPPSLF